MGLLALPYCAIVAEASRLDVGRGVAVVDLQVVAAASERGCRLDFGAVLLAREEGRAAPELVAWRSALLPSGGDQHGGPRGPVVVTFPREGGAARVIAVLRGERFIAAPLSTDRARITRPVRFHAAARSTWGNHAIAATARWIDVGVPLVVAVDAARDHEPMRLDAIVTHHPPSALVIDAGPTLAEPPASSDRGRALAEGGAAALSVLMVEAPLAIATAKDDASALERLRDAAQLALAASSAADPLLGALGQRLATSIASGFRTCARTSEVAVPNGWPALDGASTETGVLDDPEAGCPRVASAIAANHASLQLAREGGAALRDALLAPRRAWPRIGPLVPTVAPLTAEHRRPRSHFRRVARAIGALFALILVGWALRRLPGKLGSG